MEYPKFTHYGLDQVTQVPSESWEEFFRLCREYAAIARQRRAARMASAEDANTAAAPALPLPHKP